MTSSLIDSLATTEPLAAVFSDASVLQAMLDVEAALALAEARAGVIPQSAADAVRAAAKAEHFDAAAIARDGRASATIVIPLVNALAKKVAEAAADHARFVHFGATSQDISDSAIVLLLKRSRPILEKDHERLTLALRRLSGEHARTVMLGRTLLQAAPPITFGLKAARWYSSLVRTWSKVDAAFEDALIVQLGGASGTLAALGDRGLDVQRLTAEALGLSVPDGPWHTERDRLAALVTSLAIYTAALGKIARDVSLLMQEEVGEASEPGGGSSAMPHKRNPSGCAIALAAATRMPSLAAAFLAGMIQEHERAAGGWQSEWPTLAAAVQTAGAAAAAMAGAVEGLTVNVDRMRANIERTNGVIFAERVTVAIAPHAGKESAQAIVESALKMCRASGGSFREALAAVPEASAFLSADLITTIDVPEDYLGAAEAIRLRLLS